MGRTYLFDCPKCGHRAKVAGGAERGLHFAVQTLLCRDCRELFDAVTAWKTAAQKPAGLTSGAAINATRKPAAAAPTFLVALNRLPPRGGKRLRWVHFPPVCPVSPRHRVREWRSPDQCPKCGCLLEANAIPFRVWD